MVIRFVTILELYRLLWMVPKRSTCPKNHSFQLSNHLIPGLAQFLETRKFHRNEYFSNCKGHRHRSCNCKYDSKFGLLWCPKRTNSIVQYETIPSSWFLVLSISVGIANPLLSYQLPLLGNKFNLPLSLL